MFCTACATPNPPEQSACAVCGGGLRGGRPAAVAGAAADRGAERGRARRRGALHALYLAPLAVAIAAASASAVVANDATARLEGHYQRGVLAEAAGDHLAAEAAFALAGAHRDAADRRSAAATALAPQREARDRGVEALERGDYDAAIAALLPVARRSPGLDDAADRLADARRALADGRRQPLDGGAHGPLVVALDRDLWLVGPDGADAAPLTEGIQALWPVWDPDRTRVAFLTVDPQDPTGEVALMVVRPGEAPREIARSVSAHAPAAWSPDGRTLAYTSFAAYDPLLESGPIGVRVVDVASGEETDLTGDRFDLAFNPVFSPDGEQIAFVAKERRFDERPQHAPGDVWTIDARGANLQNVTDGTVPDVWSVHWQPGGDLLLLYSLYGQSWYEPPQSAIRLLDPAAGAAEVVASGSPDPLGAPAWSPDGRRFAWVAGDRTLVVRDGRREFAWEASRSLLNELTWSPDGRALLAAALEGDQPSALLRLDPASGMAGAALADVTVAYDSQQPFVGPPQWGAPGAALRDAGVPVAGTGLDGR